MAADNSDEWELSKENVRPLKQGRSFVQLQAALKPNTSIRHDQEFFETEIRTYIGDDPLHIWVNYVTWMDQNFPKGGKEVVALLKNCIDHFKNDARYFNDSRFIKIWIKFADCNINAGDFYQFMFNNKIGCELAEFYEAWALSAEQIGNSVVADAIYKEGVKVGAHPLDHLMRKHGEFQARVARDAIAKMANSSEDAFEEPAEPQRLVLGGLKPQGKLGRAPVVRTGSHRPEKLPLVTANKKTSGSSSSIPIFNDENASSCRLPSQNRELTQVPYAEVVSRENEQKASKWTNVRMKQRGLGNIAAHPQELPFLLHEDIDVEQPLVTPHKIADGTGILSVRAEPAGASAINDLRPCNGATKQISMYCKDKIEAGVREFSFEELRAAAWSKKKREEEEMQSRIQQEVKQQLQFLLKRMKLEPNAVQINGQGVPEIAESYRSLICGMDVDVPVAESDNVHMRDDDTPRQDVAARTINATLTAAEKSIALAPADPVIETDPVVETDDGLCVAVVEQNVLAETRKRAPLRDSVAKIQPHFEAPNAHRYVARSDGVEYDTDVHMQTPDTKTTPNPATIAKPQNASFLSRPSPTVHTKQAMAVVRTMFCFDETRRQSDIEFENQFQLDSNETAHVAPAFKIFADPNSTRSETENSSKQNSAVPPEIQPATGAVDIYVDPLPEEPVKCPQPTSAFTVYEDVEEPVKERGEKISDQNFTGAASRPGIGKMHAGAESVAVDENRAGNRIGRFGAKPLADRRVRPSLPGTQEGQETLHGCALVQPNCDGETVVAKRVGGHFAESLFDDEMNYAYDNGEMIVAPSGQLSDADITFRHPKMSSTENLSHLVRFAAASGALDHVAQEPENIDAELPENIGNTGHQVQNKNRKSSFMWHLDPIQERSEDSRSRTSSADSHYHSSSSKQSRTTSSSNSSGSRSSVQHQSSHSSHGSATKHLSVTGGFHSVHSSSSATPSGGRLGILFEAPPKPSEGAMQSFHGVPDFGEANGQPDESMCVDQEDCGKDVLEASVVIDHVNPYSAAQIQSFLAELTPPISSYANFVSVDGCLPRFAVRAKVRFGDDTYVVKSKLGQGGYAKVYEIVDADGAEDGDSLVVKVQSPACLWEFYITSELHLRLLRRESIVNVSKSIMFIEKAYFYADGSCLLNEGHKHGTLLDFVNSYKSQKRLVPEWLILLLSIELFHIVEQMHSCKIIHGDLKPDNILVCRPRRLKDGESAMSLIRDSTSFLKLIDFGQSIDMTMFPPGTTFLTSSATPDLQCPEIRSNRPWTYQVDYFGLISTTHVLLTESYIKICQSGGRWTVFSSIPRSFKSRDVWHQVVNDFLNIPDCNSLPDLGYYRSQLEKVFLEEFSAEEYDRCLQSLKFDE